jgi:hypothetical protein
MKSNYFYDLPDELQGFILQLAEEAELRDFMEAERREVERRSRVTYEWFNSLWKKPPAGGPRPY